jgi:hypothetical protein
MKLSLIVLTVSASFSIAAPHLESCHCDDDGDNITVYPVNPAESTSPSDYGNNMTVYPVNPTESSI